MNPSIKYIPITQTFSSYIFLSSDYILENITNLLIRQKHFLNYSNKQEAIYIYTGLVFYILHHKFFL